MPVFLHRVLLDRVRHPIYWDNTHFRPEHIGKGADQTEYMVINYHITYRWLSKRLSKHRSYHSLVLSHRYIITTLSKSEYIFV